MIERVAIPVFESPMVGLEAWRSALRDVAPNVGLRDEGGESYLVIAELGVRGQVSFDGADVEAILFEVEAADEATTLAALERAAAAVGYELLDPEDDDDEEDED